ncbi:hypothetical protein MNBD_GAMMA02-238, partial [hydrothermal vent metagenome]
MKGISIKINVLISLVVVISFYALILYRGRLIETA